MQQTFIICNHICKPQFYQVSYESEAVLDIYIKEGFNLLTVYHRSNQLKEVQRDIIDPLANVFRPYYVFITHDMYVECHDEHVMFA